MSMTDPAHPLAPALSADQWAKKAVSWDHWRAFDDVAPTMEAGESALLLSRADDDGITTMGVYGPAPLLALIALANHALPDGHGGKITGDAVLALYSVVRAVAGAPVGDRRGMGVLVWIGDDQAAQLAGLLDALRSILPARPAGESGG